MRTTKSGKSDGDDATEASGYEGPAGFASLLKEIARLPDAAPSIPEPDRVGQNIAQFRLLSKLGHGGMGIVYRAEDLTLRREAALKVLPFALALDARRREGFLREARLAAAVMHPNLVTVFEVGELEDTIYIAMERVEGVTLRALLAQRGGRLASDETVRIALEIVRGVAHAHDCGIVHRDLKPENVMITLDGAAKVLDFGLARWHETHALAAAAAHGMDAAENIASRGTRMAGTPPYMSPEQVAGAPVDARSDIFSIGVMFYEMVSGGRPFRGGSTREILRSIEHDEPRPLREAAPGLPAPLASLIERCLCKPPGGRFVDGRALLNALEVLELQLEEMQDAGTQRSSWRWWHAVLANVLLLTSLIALQIAAPKVEVRALSNGMRLLLMLGWGGGVASVLVGSRRRK